MRRLRPPKYQRVFHSRVQVRLSRVTVFARGTIERSPIPRAKKAQSARKCASDYASKHRGKDASEASGGESAPGGKSIDLLSLQPDPSPARMSREATFEQRTHDELKLSNDLIEAMYRYFSSGEVVHIPARDSQHTQAAAPLIASQHTECEIPPAATEANAEHVNVVQ